MGCGGSKQEDINKSRQRQPVQQPTNVQPSTQTTPIASPMSAKKYEYFNFFTFFRQDSTSGENTSEYGKSYTDMKNKEKLMFMNIITKAQHNLIDMRQSPGIGDDQIEDDEQQPADASENLLPSSAQLDLSQHVELFGLPLPSEHAMAKQNNNLKEMFCEGNLTLDDVQQLARFTAAIVQAHANNIKVNDENMEPLVVSLPEIEMLA